MIRYVEPVHDSSTIAEIYNHYVDNTTITFETAPVSVDEMAERVTEISQHYPYFVYEMDGQIIGYCYVHAWKSKAAYDCTLETTVYMAPGQTGRGLAVELMNRLIEECRSRGYKALIACITGGNEPSCRMHRKLGFSQVSYFKSVGFKFGKYLDVVDYELLL